MYEKNNNYFLVYLKFKYYNHIIAWLILRVPLHSS